MTRQLGRIQSRQDHRTLDLRDFARLPDSDVPAARRWDNQQPLWLKAGNDQYGNCVVATASHMLLNWRANELDRHDPIADTAVIDLSREMGALNGYMILDRLKWWRRDGMWASKIWAYLQIPHRDPAYHRFAINAFGASDIGLALPSAWQTEAVWDVGSGRRYRPGSWGLHSVPLVGYDEHAAYCVTWGAIQTITWNAVKAYCDEAWAVLSPVWLAADAISPPGFDLAALAARLRALASDVQTHQEPQRNAS